MNKNITNDGAIYGTWKTDFGAWGIGTKNVTMYLLVGEKQALLIDTGYGEGDLPELVREITDLPLIVVNTHGHFDHTSGNAFFESVWMGEGGEEPALECETRTQLPFPDYKINYLSDGQIFDLGGVIVEAIAIGAHHRSSFAFLDKTNRTLYTGDEIEAGQVLLCVHGEDVTPVDIAKKHRANMLKLQARNNEFDRLATAHNGGPLDITYIDDFIELSNQIENGTAFTFDTCAGYGWPNYIFGGDAQLRRVKYNKATFILKR